MRVPPSNSRGLSALEISGGILKNDDISAAASHRFIAQPASGRSSALPCLAAILVLSEIWRLLRLHGLFFGTICRTILRPVLFSAGLFYLKERSPQKNKRLRYSTQPLYRYTQNSFHAINDPFFEREIYRRAGGEVQKSADHYPHKRR